MKARNNRKFEGALLEIVQKLGIKRCSKVVDKSTSLIRKWSDPDHFTWPSLQQAFALDLEYAREFHSIPPLLHVYSLAIQRDLEAAEVETADDNAHILTTLLTLQGAVCDLGKKITNEINYPNKKISNGKNIKKAMFNDIDAILRKTHNLELAVNVMCSASKLARP